MKREPTNQEIEQDPIWDLIRQSPRHEARPSFVDDVVRASRQTPEPWWKRFWIPITTGGLATAATAAVAIYLMGSHTVPTGAPYDTSGFADNAAAKSQPIEALDEIAHTEALLLASDDPSSFSDAELVALITY